MKLKIKSRLKRILGLEKVVIAKPDDLMLDGVKSLLVLAPHSDDEVLGCGGLLLTCQRMKRDVSWVVICNGAKGTEFTSLRGEALIEMRQQETWSAASELGVKNCQFLGLPDTSLKNNRETRAAIHDALNKTNYDMIALPYIYDAHTDHYEAASAILDVMEQISYSGRILMYEVWTPLPANRVIPINWEEKKRLIAYYQTQLGENGFYYEGARSLAKFRSMTALDDPNGFAECFLELNLDDLSHIR